jgi:hypothetical protein
VKPVLFGESYEEDLVGHDRSNLAPAAGRWAKTKFPFPPRSLGMWIPLSRRQREEWLVAACNRHFKWARRRRGWQDAKSGSVFVIDGATIVDLPGFFCALGESINGPGGYFGRSPGAMEDCLYGGFGVTLPCVVRIRNVDACRRHLDGNALAEYAWQHIARDVRDDEGWHQFAAYARNGRQQVSCLLDWLLEVLQFHGVTIDAEIEESP